MSNLVYHLVWLCEYHIHTKVSTVRSGCWIFRQCLRLGIIHILQKTIPAAPLQMHWNSVKIKMIRRLLCILTSFWVLPAPKSWSNYFFQLFSTFFRNLTPDINKKVWKRTKKLVFVYSSKVVNMQKLVDCLEIVFFLVKANQLYRSTIPTIKMKIGWAPTKAPP